MRLVVPGAMILQAAGLDDAHAEGRTEKLLEFARRRTAGRRGARGSARTSAAAMGTHMTTHVPQEPGIPVALRWASDPLIGFPRAPFLVWRRPRDYKAGVGLGNGPFAVSGTRTMTWTAGEMIEVLFRATPAAAALTVEALDASLEPIPGQRIVFAADSLGVFRSPGIRAIRASGVGSVRSLVGVDQHDLANRPDWQLVQRVGFPFDAGEIASPAYTSAPQGFEPASLEGLAAAEERLAFAAIMQLDPPDTGIAGVVTPAWPAPDPKPYLRVLRDPSPSPLELIDACLNGTDDGDPNRLQADFAASMTVDGIRQANLPGATPGDPATAAIPVVGVTMLSVANDSDAATGLGYGTIDIPPLGGMRNPYGNALLPPGVVIPAVDYMVSAEYTFPFFGTLELAAIAQGLPRPDTPAGMQAQASTGDRPPAVDTAASEVVTLSWSLPARQQAYGVAVTRTAGVTEVLNAARAFSAGGYDPYVPLRPPDVNGLPPAGARTRYTDAVAPSPLAGSITSRYLALGRDVAGRWSPWSSVLHTSTAPPVEAPGLLSAAWELPPAPLAVPPSGRSTPGTLVVELTWDWADRTPEKIELFGTFFAPAGTPPGGFTGGFATAPTGPIGPAVTITFGTGGAPSIASGPTGTVEVIAAPSGTTPGDTRRYRLRLPNLTCSFASATQVAYAVTARGYERVRPTVASVVVGPRVARANDPFQPATPALPIDLIWTALPDAAGRARAVLTWPATAGATKYVVWEATEAALRTAVAPTAAPPPAGTSILARAGALRSLVTANAASQALSLKAFSRMHDRPLQATSLELELPGAADTLYAYRVSSLTDSNVESPRSATVALVAVPRRSVPGRPRVLLRRSDSPEGIDVIVLPGTGPTPAGYRLHRVRNPVLANEVGMMGPPRYTPASTGWSAVSVPSLDGSSEAGMAMFDPVARSWYAYHYRAVAIGQSDPTNGIHPGESGPSAPVSLVLPPTSGPTLDAVSRVGGNTANQVITFRTDLPVRPSPLGTAQIVVSAVATVAGAVKRHVLLATDPSTVREGTALSVLAVGSPGLAGMPHISRAAPDPAGRAVYTVRLPGTLPDSATGGTIAVRDPLGRSLEVSWP